MDKSSYVIVMIWLLLITTAACDRSGDKDYVDPTDILNFDPVKVRMKTGDPQRVIPERNNQDETSHDSDSSNKQVSCNKSDQKELKKSFERLDTLHRQNVLMLVSHLEKKVGRASEPVDINLRLKISFHDLTKLQLYGKKKSQDVNDVYEILNYMVQYASDIIPQETKIRWLESRLGLSVPVLFQILVILLSVIFLLKTVPTITITGRLLRNVIFWAFLASVIFNWMEMYQKEVADQERKLMERMKDSCPNSDDMSWLSRVSSYIFSSLTFKDNKCQEFHHAMLVNPIVKVTPMEAVANAVVKTVVAPLGIIGAGIKTFLVALLKDLPVQYQVWVFIILAIVVLVTPFLARGYGFNLFHMINIAPAPQYLPPGPSYQPLPEPRSSYHSQHQLPANDTRPLTHSQSEVQIKFNNNPNDSRTSSGHQLNHRHIESTRDTSLTSGPQGSIAIQGNTVEENIAVDILGGGDTGLQSDSISSSTGLSSDSAKRGDDGCKELCHQVSDLKISEPELKHLNESVDSVTAVSKEMQKMSIFPACSSEEKTEEKKHNEISDSKDLESEKRVAVDLSVKNHTEEEDLKTCSEKKHLRGTQEETTTSKYS